MAWLGGVRSNISVPDTMQGKARCIRGRAIRGRIVADVFFGDQKHKLASLKNVSIILDNAPILGLWLLRFPAFLASEEIRKHDCGIASVHGAVGSARLTHGSDG